MNRTYLELKTINKKFASQIVAFSISANGAEGADAGTIGIVTTKGSVYTVRLDDKKANLKLAKYFTVIDDESVVAGNHPNWKMTNLSGGNYLFLIDWLDECFYQGIDRNQEIAFNWLEKVLAILKYNTARKVKNLPYDKSEWVYEHSKDNTARFALGTKGEKTLICFGVNPSTASPNDLDPTVNNVKAFANKNGYDSYIMLNLYPQRATNPYDMHEELDIELKRNNEKNIKSIFEKIMHEQGKINILAAWGTLITKNKYLKNCFVDIAKITQDYQCNWICLGQTKYLHPKHPSRLSHDTPLVSFDINNYMSIIL